MLRRFKVIALIVFVGSIESLWAQTNTSSPYSRFGIGDLTIQGVGRNQMMGGLGVSTSNSLFINNVNPALLARTNNVIFNFGLGSSSKFLKTNSQVQNSTNTNIDMVNMSFPISKKWTSGFGLRPYSNVDYDISTTDAINDTTNMNLKYAGTGGISQFYFSNGYTLKRGLYIGLETSYLFGNITKESQSQLDFDGSGLDATKSVFADRTNFSDFTFKPGVAFRREIKIVRDTIYGTLKSKNPYYKKFKERLDYCIDTLPNETVKITEPQKAIVNLDTLDKAARKEFLKADGKRLLEHHKKNAEAKSNYCKECLKDADNNVLKKDTFYTGNKRFVAKDTFYIGNKLSSKSKVNRLYSRSYDGKYLILVPQSSSITISDKISDKDESLRIKTFVTKIKTKETGVIVKKDAEGVDLKSIGHDLDELMIRMASDSINNKKGSKSYLKEHISEGSGIFWNVGATYEFKNDLRASNVQVLERRKTDEEVVGSDTLNLNESGFVTLPSSLKFGFGLERPVPAGLNKFGKVRKSVWSIGVDLGYTQWSQYKSFTTGQDLKDSYRFVIGGEIIPDIKYKGKGILPLLVYRAGLHYEKTAIEVNSVQLNDFGINFGVSVPVFNLSSRFSMPRYLDLGLTFGQRGTTDNNLIRENYIRGTVNFTINNSWFKTYKQGL